MQEARACAISASFYEGRRGYVIKQLPFGLLLVRRSFALGAKPLQPNFNLFIVMWVITTSLPICLDLSCFILSLYVLFYVFLYCLISSCPDVPRHVLSTFLVGLTSCRFVSIMYYFVVLYCIVNFCIVMSFLVCFYLVLYLHVFFSYLWSFLLYFMSYSTIWLFLMLYFSCLFFFCVFLCLVIFCIVLFFIVLFCIHYACLLSCVDYTSRLLL
jgi:hypothetical protein